MHTKKPIKTQGVNWGGQQIVLVATYQDFRKGRFFDQISKFVPLASKMKAFMPTFTSGQNTACYQKGVPDMPAFELGN